MSHLIRVRLEIDPDEKLVYEAVAKFMGLRYVGDLFRDVMRGLMKVWACMNWPVVEQALKAEGVPKAYIDSIFKRFGCERKVIVLEEESIKAGGRGGFTEGDRTEAE